MSKVAPTPADAQSGKSPKAFKEDADSILPDALVGIGFNTNFWSFDPLYVRRLFQVMSVLFAALSIWSFSHWGGYKWMFLCFDLTFLGLLKYWYSRVECGGGRHIFSPDWRDSFVRTHVTRTNYVVEITVGYESDMKVSIPFSDFKYDDDKKVDLKWLALQLDQGLPMGQFRAKQILQRLHQDASRPVGRP